MSCRHCGATLHTKMIDLGTAPLSNSYLESKDLTATERTYPLRVWVCETCWLVQTEDFVTRENIFHEDYAYFSSVSETWSEHVDAYAQDVIRRFSLDRNSFVVEVACNDGCLLESFDKREIRSIGVEPTESAATLARERGLNVIVDFFDEALGTALAQNYGRSDLVIANNVLAHVPDINDFVRGFARILQPTGVATFEYPHLLNMIESNLFDTIYHEHYSYLSLTTVDRIMRRNGLRIFDAEKLSTHGGSLRVFVKHDGYSGQTEKESVRHLLHLEMARGLTEIDTYLQMQSRAEKMKTDALAFLTEAKRSEKLAIGYGAAAKGSTFLNFAGITSDLLPFVVDKNPAKQNLFMPGSQIPIVSEDKLKELRPNYIVIFPWNIRVEIERQIEYAKTWDAKIVVFVPNIQIFEFSDHQEIWNESRIT